MKKILFLIIVCTMAMSANAQIDKKSNLRFDLEETSTMRNETLREPARPTMSSSLKKVNPYFEEITEKDGSVYITCKIYPTINSTLFRTGNAYYLLNGKTYTAKLSGNGGRRGVDATSRYVNTGDCYTIVVVIEGAGQWHHLNEVSMEVWNSYGGQGTITLRNVNW